MEALTKRQLEVLTAIRSLTERLGYPPTRRELGEVLGIGSTNGVSDHLHALERKGWIRIDDKRSRGIHVLSHDLAPAEDAPDYAARLEQKRVACLAIADQLRRMIDGTTAEGRLVAALVAGLQPESEAA